MGFPLIGLAIGIAGTLIEAEATAEAAQAEAKAANVQLKADMEVERIDAMNKANARLEEFRKLEAANRVNAAINGPAGSIDYSYEGGIRAYNREIAANDVASIAFNAGQKVGRLGYQIKVNRFQADWNTRSARIGGVASSMQQAGSFIISQSSLAAPTPAKPG